MADFFIEDDKDEDLFNSQYNTLNGNDYSFFMFNEEEINFNSQTQQNQITNTSNKSSTSKNSGYIYNSRGNSSGDSQAPISLKENLISKGLNNEIEIESNNDEFDITDDEITNVLNETNIKKENFQIPKMGISNIQVQKLIEPKSIFQPISISTKISVKNTNFNPKPQIHINTNQKFNFELNKPKVNLPHPSFSILKPLENKIIPRIPEIKINQQKSPITPFKKCEFNVKTQNQIDIINSTLTSNKTSIKPNVLMNKPFSFIQNNKIENPQISNLKKTELKESRNCIKPISINFLDIKNELSKPHQIEVQNNHSNKLKLDSNLPIHNKTPTKMEKFSLSNEDYLRIGTRGLDNLFDYINEYSTLLLI